MNAGTRLKDSTNKWTRRLAVPMLAVALAASFVTYEFAKPASARAAEAAPSAAPLDADSVGALLALDKAMETLAARVTPAVVNVTVTSRTRPDMAGRQGPEDMQQFFGQGGQGGPFGQFFGQHMQRQPQIEHGMGSGVVISPDGYIVTNNHVVEGAVDIRVTTSNRRVLKAKLIGTDPLTDLAVLKVDATGLASAPWGDSKEVRPGQTVLAFGNPYGFRFTVTRGIVSAVNRANPDPTNPSKPGEFIQTDAAINPGNSGGPLVDARGEVVGINTFLVSPSGTFSGMGFAIPTQIVRPTVETLIRDGKVSHGHIGIGIADVTPENAKFFDETTAAGGVVTQVEPDSPGAKAGLQIGDVITEIDGQKVSDAGELQVLVGQKQPGAKIMLRVLRDGKTISVPVTLEELGSRSSEGKEDSGSGEGKMHWGIGLSNLTPELRDQLQAPSDIHGAVIEQVQPGSPADNAGLQRGDIILEVNRHKVQSASDVQQALAKVPKGEDALLLVYSNGGNTFRVLHSPEGA
ncbi:MAG TPA: Do family serine endopeptidase [Candidatus Sulfotelmatobacter sp.]|nr:Do family serine endopeptidase [Candidatus Sulfotelmatobacter sp.]